MQAFTDALFSDKAWFMQNCSWAIIALIIRAVFKRAPKFGRGWLQGSKIRLLQRVRETRRSSLMVNYHMVKAGCYFVLFLGSIILGLCLSFLTSYTLNPEAKFVSFTVIAFATPALVFEILWLRQDQFVLLLIRHSTPALRGAVRNTRSARRDKLRALRRLSLKQGRSLHP